MTKRFKSLLLVLLAAAVAACTAAGCSIGTPDLDEILENYTGGHVTYYGNGGKFDGMSIGVREIYYQSDGVPFFDIQEQKSDSTSASSDTSDSGNVTISYDGYDFGGWYEAARYTSGEHEGEIIYTYTDSSGNTDYVYIVDGEEDDEARPYYARAGRDEKIEESNVTVVASDTKVTSSTIIHSGDTLAVCAVWTLSLRIEYRLVLDDATATYKDADGNEYKDGDVLGYKTFGSGETASTGGFTKNLVGATFVKRYADKACTQEASSVSRPENGEDVVVWCKYIGGTWTIVSDRDSAVDMFKSLSDDTINYYILNDIDLSGETLSLKSYNKETLTTIQGNGHTISNITVSGSSVNYDFGALFGKFGETANISNLKIDNVTVSVTARKSVNGAAISYGIAESAKITGLEISNITMTVDSPATAESYIGETNWLFGQSTTDEDFLAANKGITVSGTNTLSLT